MNGTPGTRRPRSHADSSVQWGAHSAGPGPSAPSARRPSITGEAGARETERAQNKRHAAGGPRVPLQPRGINGNQMWLRRAPGEPAPAAGTGRSCLAGLRRGPRHAVGTGSPGRTPRQLPPGRPAGVRAGETVPEPSSARASPAHTAMHQGQGTQRGADGVGVQRPAPPSRGFSCPHYCIQATGCGADSGRLVSEPHHFQGSSPQETLKRGSLRALPARGGGREHTQPL